MDENNISSFDGKRILVMVLIIVVIIVLFLYLIDLERVVEEISEADPRFLIGASASFIIGLIFYAARWRALLQKKPSLLFTFHTSNVGHAGNILLPLRAGEPLRILIMGTDKNVSYAEATSSFVVERLFETLMRLVTFSLALAVGLGLDLSLESILGGLALLLLGFGAIGWLANNQDFSLKQGTRLLAKIPKVTEEQAKNTVADLLENIKSVSEPREFFTVLFYSFASWTFFWGFFYLTLLSLGDAFPSDFVLPISLGAMALSPPSAPTQPGIFHASVVVPLAALGFEAGALTAYAVLLHILELIWITALGIWGFIATGSSWGVIRDLFKTKS